MITKFKAESFTVFSDIDIRFSPGINIIVGENGTGKTHLMKAMYSACSIIGKNLDRTLAQKVNAVFMPDSIGRLVHRTKGRSSGGFTVYRKKEEDAKERSITLSLTTLGKAEQKSVNWHEDTNPEVTFIPVKDMLANAPGFRSLFSSKVLPYEEVYLDILDKAFMPVSRGLSKEREKLLKHLQMAMDGKVVNKDEKFYLKNKSGNLEFPLLAEGYRKLGLLYLLIQNESLIKGSVLFWDEPEANLNPKLSSAVVNILLELQRMGVQIFITTHDYVLLKEFDLAAISSDNVLYHTLYKENDVVRCASTSVMDEMSPNAIDDTFARLLDTEIQKGLSDL